MGPSIRDQIQRQAEARAERAESLIASEDLFASRCKVFERRTQSEAYGRRLPGQAGGLVFLFWF